MASLYALGVGFRIFFVYILATVVSLPVVWLVCCKVASTVHMTSWKDLSPR